MLPLVLLCEAQRGGRGGAVWDLGRGEKGREVKMALERNMGDKGRI